MARIHMATTALVAGLAASVAAPPATAQIDDEPGLGAPSSDILEPEVGDDELAPVGDDELGIGDDELDPVGDDGVGIGDDQIGIGDEKDVGIGDPGLLEDPELGVGGELENAPADSVVGGDELGIDQDVGVDEEVGGVGEGDTGVVGENTGVVGDDGGIGSGGIGSGGIGVD